MAAILCQGDHPWHDRPVVFVYKEANFTAVLYTGLHYLHYIAFVVAVEIVWSPDNTEYTHALFFMKLYTPFLYCFLQS